MSQPQQRRQQSSPSKPRQPQQQQPQKPKPYSKQQQRLQKQHKVNYKEDSDHEESNGGGGYEIYNTNHLALKERLLACLHNGTMTDVTLVGDDGIPVPACRFLLGAASPVLQPLLYQQNQTVTQGKVVVTIREATQTPLQALVEYCCCDKLNTSLWQDASAVQIVQDAVQLCHLACTYEMPPLMAQVGDFLNPLLTAYPPLACLVYNLADEETILYPAALKLLREQPYQSFVSVQNTTTTTSNNNSKIGGMVHLSPEKLEQLLKDPLVQCDEWFLFQQLVAWKDHHLANYKYDPKQLLAICKYLVQKYIDLADIDDPEALEATVQKSGFVDDTMLVQALMRQAKSARQTSSTTFRSLQPTKRGNKFVSILVQGAGDALANGVYVPFTKSNNDEEGVVHKKDKNDTTLYFIQHQPYKGPNKKPPLKTFVLVKDTLDTWRICDNKKNIVYQCVMQHDVTKASQDPFDAVFPSQGWDRVTGVNPAPTCEPYKGNPDAYYKDKAEEADASNKESTEEEKKQEDEEDEDEVPAPPPPPPAPVKKPLAQKESTATTSSMPKLVMRNKSDGTDMSGQEEKSVHTASSSHRSGRSSRKDKARAKEVKKTTRQMSLMDDDNYYVDEEEEEEEIVVAEESSKRHSPIPVEEVEEEVKPVSSKNRSSDPLVGKEVGGNGFQPANDVNELMGLKHQQKVVKKAAATFERANNNNNNNNMAPEQSMLSACSGGMPSYSTPGTTTASGEPRLTFYA